MSAADKTKLDGIAENANNYTHPSYGKGQRAVQGDGGRHRPCERGDSRG